MRNIMLGLSAIAMAAVSAPAFAQDGEVAPDFKLTGGVTAVSDYRFRGLSLSDEDFAVQPTLTVSHSSGFYVGFWGSNLDNNDANPYGEFEVDLYAGWTGEVVSGTTIDAAVVYYYYPDQIDNDGIKVNYFEPYVTVAHTFGPVTAKAGVNWAFSQDATGNEDWWYKFGQLSMAVPNTPLTVTAKVGHQSFSGLLDSYFDYSVGATATFGPATAGVTFVATDVSQSGPAPAALAKNADDKVVFSLGVAF